MIVRYKKGITGYLFYFSIGDLHYCVVWRSKQEFKKHYQFKNVKFVKID